MKIIKYIPVVFCLLCAAACFEDESTMDTVRISEITIDTLKIQKVYNVDQHEELSIPTKDIVSESEAQLPLRYEWDVNYNFYSDSSVFYYVGSELGSFPVRLKVSNDHGSSFYEFTVNVNSPYETGIAILSENGEGEPLLSIMRELSDKEIGEGVERTFKTNCLAINNPDIEFPKYPTDLVSHQNQLFISFKGIPSIYMLNSKVLNVESVIEENDENFIPTKILLPAKYTKGNVLTESGKVYSISTKEGVVLANSSFPSIYNERMALMNEGYQIGYMLWDRNNSAIIYELGGYNYYSTRDEEANVDLTGHTPIALYFRDNTFCTLLSQKDGVFMKTTISKNFYDTEYNDDWTEWWNVFNLVDDRTPINGSPELTAETPSANCKTYQSFYYAIGNKIYRWYYNTETSFPTQPWRTIELDGAEITSLSVDPDDKQLYVGVYQPAQPELNGSFYILNADTGKDAEGPWLNVAYKPLKIIYKKQ